MPCCLCCFLAYNVLYKGEKTPPKHTVISRYYYYFLLFHSIFFSISNNNVDKGKKFMLFYTEWATKIARFPFCTCPCDILSGVSMYIA